MKRVVLACLLLSLPLLGGKSVVDIGSDRQLFLDRDLIDEMRGAEFELHRPVLREEVLRYDKPWEGDTSWHPIVIRDGERFRMWYRVSQGNHDGVAQTAYAESKDGIHWERPSLGLVESKGSTDNNLIWPTVGNQGINMCVFKDPNPGVPEGERYKAIVQTRDIHGLVSADGLHWEPIQPEPLIRRLQDQVNDGPHAAFWDPWQSRYVIYKRGWWGATPEKQLDASGTSGEANRTIRRFTSRDFLTWDGPEWVEIPFGTHPREQFYTSAAIPYPWARNVYLMFPMRFILDREGEGWPFPGLSEHRPAQQPRRAPLAADLPRSLDPSRTRPEQLARTGHVLRLGPGPDRSGRALHVHDPQLPDPRRPHPAGDAAAGRVHLGPCPRSGRGVHDPAVAIQGEPLADQLLHLGHGIGPGGGAQPFLPTRPRVQPEGQQRDLRG